MGVGCAKLCHRRSTKAIELNAARLEETGESGRYGANKLILLQCEELSERPNPPTGLTPENAEDHRCHHAEQGSSSAFVNPTKSAERAGERAKRGIAAQGRQSGVDDVGQLFRPAHQAGEVNQQVGGVTIDASLVLAGPMW